MIKLVRLHTGEDVLAEVTVTEDSYKLDKPIRVILMPDGSAGMMPFLALSKEESVTIPSRFIVYSLDPEDELMNAYNSRFGSGIIVPTSAVDVNALQTLRNNIR